MFWKPRRLPRPAPGFLCLGTEPLLGKQRTMSDRTLWMASSPRLKRRGALRQAQVTELSRGSKRLLHPEDQLARGALLPGGQLPPWQALPRGREAPLSSPRATRLGVHPQQEENASAPS